MCLQKGNLILNGCDLQGKVRFRVGEVTQNLLESSDVSLHRQTHGLLCLVPETLKRNVYYYRLTRWASDSSSNFFSCHDVLQLPLKNTHANTVPENYLMKLLKSRRDRTHLTLKSSVASLALSMLSTTPPLIPTRAIILQQEQEKLKFRPWTTTN